MKKKVAKYLYFIFTVLLFIVIMPTVHAGTYKQYTGKITATLGLNVRKDKTTSSEIVGALSYNSTFKYRDEDVYEGAEGSGCGYWIYVGSRNGYVCKDYVEVIETVDINDYSDSEMAQMTDEEFDAYLDEEGFDETYKVKLKELHKKYPSWVFKGIKTNRDWTSSVKEESQIGYSTYYLDQVRISAGHEAYLNTESHYSWETDWFSGYDGWFFLANEPTVAYFLDPRNYLSESNIFVFETLYFNDTYQNKDIITTILNTDKYNDYIYDTGKAENYSPIAIAIKIKQEGTLNNRPTLGNIDVKCSGTINPVYDATNGVSRLHPLYNFFNIGATSSPSNADLNGLCYAATTNENYLLPWNTEERAIKGGIKWIADQYVKVGQYTNYFQKFNTAIPNTELWHQYMTNLEDPKSQSSIIYQIYSNINILSSPFVFYIPIYNDMPEKTELPKLGNPNNWLTSLSYSIDGKETSVSNFNGNTTEYTITVPNYINNITINSTTVARTSYVSIDKSNSVLKSTSKQVALPSNENVFEIVVTAANGNTKTYTLTVIKEEAPTEQPTIEEMLEQAQLKLDATYVSGITFGMGSNTLTEKLLEINPFATIVITNNKDEVKTAGALGTSDKLTITSNNETKTFEIVLYGDANGDGDITLVDIVTLQKHLWGDAILTGVRLKAADANKDGTLMLNDIVMIQKHLWKDAIISQ